MIYIFKITTLSNVLESDPTETILSLEKGVINGIQITFPSGSQGLLHLVIKNSLHQVWPRNSDDSFSGDNITVKWEDSYTIIMPPYNLQAYTWNNDDTYDHSLWLHLFLSPQKIDDLPVDWLQQLEEQRMVY